MLGLVYVMLMPTSVLVEFKKKKPWPFKEEFPKVGYLALSVLF